MPQPDTLFLRLLFLFPATVKFRRRGEVFLPVFFLLAVLLPSHCRAGCNPSPLLQRLAEVPRLTWTVQAMLPHDPKAFTQGLLMHGNKFYESTGLYGASSLREIDAASGRVLRLYRLPPNLFGEGLCLADGRLIQLTWKTGTAFIHDVASFAILDRRHYDSEGWGLTAGDGKLFMSDGSSFLAVRDPDTFEVIKKIRVHDGKGPIENLNELEYVRGAIFANVWKENCILRIKTENGRITGYIDLGDLPQTDRGCGTTEAVANGIAYAENSGLLYVTGKLWPYVFVLKVDFGE